MWHPCTTKTSEEKYPALCGKTQIATGCVLYFATNSLPLHNQHIAHHSFVWQTTDRNRLRSVFCHKFSGFLHFATTHHTNLQKGTCKPGFLWQNTDHTRGNRKPGFVWQNTDCNRLRSVFCHKFSTLAQPTHRTNLQARKWLAKHSASVAFWLTLLLPLLAVTRIPGKDHETRICAV